MFDALKSLFGGAKSDHKDDEPDTATAAAALMVEAALADGEFSPVEREKIELILREGFKLDEAAATTTLEEAERLVASAVDHHQFTRVVKSMTQAQRFTIMTHLWMVALADGDKDDHEDSLLRRLSPLLALSDRERAEARQAAQELARTD